MLLIYISFHKWDKKVTQLDARCKKDHGIPGWRDTVFLILRDGDSDLSTAIQPDGICVLQDCTHGIFNRVNWQLMENCVLAAAAFAYYNAENNDANNFPFLCLTGQITDYETVKDLQRCQPVQHGRKGDGFH